MNRAELKSRLQALPEPEYTYEIAVPELPGQDGDGDDDLTAAQRALRGKPLDAAELEYQRRVAKEEELQRELARRSTVVKRGLPRPAFVSDAAAKALAQPCVDRQNCTPEQVGE